MVDAMRELESWIEHVEDPELAAELAELKASGDAAAVEDAFFRDLSFGTAGLRGVIGAGSNRMNVYTVARATQGFADYLNATFESPSVAIARDSRNKGEEFVRTAARVLAANGVRVHVYPRISPVPTLSWAVRDLGLSGGICMTASHNPAAYNGYKVYGPDGCQITSEAASTISDAIARVGMFGGARLVGFDDAVARGLVSWIPDEVLDRYVDAVLGQSVSALGPDERRAAALKVVYTPLNGTGMQVVPRVLSRGGIGDVAVVPEQAEPDGDFPTCPYPNPEIREAMEAGISLAGGLGADLLLATDPDADRVGVAVRDGDGYALLTGNEVGLLLLDYVCRSRRERGEDLSRMVAATTIVSSPMVDCLAREHGFELRRFLTGFKYIGELIGSLEAAGEEDRFLFGFEESYGYLAGTYVRDKDAVVASLLICQLAQELKLRGMSLADAMRELYGRYGHYRSKTTSLSYPGADGAARMAEIMAGLRERQPREVAGRAVESFTDYAAGGTGLPAADVLSLGLAGGEGVAVRPSGTEPKIKVYLFAKGGTAQEAEAEVASLEAAMRELLQ